MSNSPYISETQVASSTPFDNSTGKAFDSGVLDVQSALEHLRDHTIFDSQTTATTLNGTLTLTFPASTTAQFLTGTQTGFSVVMPDATTLTLSAYYKIFNTSSQTVSVKDGGGNLLFTLSQQSIGFLSLQLNGTTAGTWVWWQVSTNVASGIISYNITSTTNFSSSANADTLITGMSVVPQAGTYGIWVNYQLSGTGAGQQNDVTIYNGASAITDSKRSNLSTTGTHIFSSSTQTIAQFDGTNACSLRINPNGNNFTVGPRSLLMIRLGA